ncbi:MAG: teichoic acid transporter [Anaerolineae bacterium]|nr:teichoic acid transporter [Anaerolineae bacterium]
MKLAYLPQRLTAQLQSPLLRNAYMLIINATATSGLGLLYWVAAARFYDADTVGLSSAALSAMTFLSGIAQLSFNDAFMRFVPPAGAAVRRLVGYAYGISIGLGLAAGVVFLAGLDTWSPTLTWLRENAAIQIAFVLSVSAMALFTLQDSVLTGLRQPKYILIENAVFGVLKLGLLVGCAAWLKEYGIFVSSVVPMALLTVPVNALIFKRLMPQHIAHTQAHAQPIHPREVARYVLGNYLGVLAAQVTFTLLPVIVLNVAGKSAGAYYYLPALLATSLRLVAANLTASLTVEAALDQRRLIEYCQRVLKNGLRIVALLAAVVFVAAPYVLAVFGADYAAEGSGLLRLLALAAIPNVIIMVYIGKARVEGRVRSIVLLTLVQAALELGSSTVLLGLFGITGIGLAFCLCQTLVALVLLTTGLRAVWQRGKAG